MTNTKHHGSVKDLPPGLIYVSDDMPGIVRRKRGRGFQYLDPQGCSIDDDDEVTRINSLAVPPAYQDVWICMKPNGHLQATGNDERGRKQYRYHTQWQEYRSRLKFDHLASFGELLPRIRRRVRKNLREPELDKDFVSAALIRLIDKGHLRIGSSNESVTGAVGATSLRHKNVKLKNGQVRLDYIAKGGKRIRRQLSDKKLMQTLEQIDNLPGKRLFQYRGHDDEIYPLDSGDVNEWLKMASGDGEISAKTFRTWAGTLAAFETAQNEDDLTIRKMCEAAAQQLRNTPSICRSSYVHPAVIDLAELDTEDRRKNIAAKVETLTGLTNSETQLLAFLADA